jgi:hypothetical protein
MSRVVSQKLTKFVLFIASIVALMETVSTSKTSVNFYEIALRKIPKKSYTCCRKNLKSDRVSVSRYAAFASCGIASLLITVKRRKMEGMGQ